MALSLNKQTAMDIGLQFIIAWTSTINCFNFITETELFLFAKMFMKNEALCIN